jgi:ATP-dependent helicase/nuclease subunit B
LIEELAAICRERPLEEKILVAPSLAIGHTLAERLAREGHPWIHLRVATLRTLAADVAGPELAREGRRILSRAQALALVEQACVEEPETDSYFGALRDRPGLHRAVHIALDELRGAGLTAESLPANAFADPRKHRELSAIFRRYVAGLESGPYADGIEVLRRAAASLTSPRRRSEAPVYLLLAGTELSSLERRFLHALAAGRLLEIEGDPPEKWTDSARHADFFRATGEENEIREVFRRVLARGIPFDEVEILHTDSAVYPALAWELAREQDIASTFAEGVAVAYTRPGQAALAFLDWIAGDFDAEALRRVLASEAVGFPPPAPGAEAVGPRAAARALRDAEIGWGRERHVSCLERLVAGLERPQVPARHGQDESEVQSRARQSARRRRLEAARAARTFAVRALELAPIAGPEGCDLGSLAGGARIFVAEFSRVGDELDAAARTALDALFHELEELMPLRLDAEVGCERLRDAVSRLAIASDRPRPGRMHIAHFRSGGYSGRPHTFFLGLDENRVPGRDLEDPVLLDEERRRINDSIPDASLALGREQPRETARALRACMSRVSGGLTASYSSYDVRNLSQAGEPGASPFVLEAFRESSRRPEADFTDLAAALARPAGFVPERGMVLDETEWWLERLSRTDLAPGAAAPLVRAVYPWLGRGLRASQARDSEAFTVWDGRLASPAPELDPRAGGEPFSPSRVEQLARCPYSYFLRHVLGIEPLAEREPDRTRWLEPMDEGSLLHEVFRQFFEDVTAAGEKPKASHLPRLLEIANERMEAWKERIPPKNELALGQTEANVLFACRTFLRLEEEHCRNVTPRYYEVPFGRPRELSRTRCDIASAEPVAVDAGGGRSFLLRGSIDRVDEAPDGTFHVWDYKTGGAGKIREGVGLRGGRQIQPALYALALEALLAAAGRPARVSRSGYFFPGRRGEGQRLEVPLDREETRAVLAALFDLVAAGYFPHAVAEDDCRFCDFQEVCGGAGPASKRAASKLAAGEDPTLSAFFQLHRDAGQD